MSSIGSPSPFFLAGKKAYQVERSLRFNSGDNPELTRTPSGAGNRKTWTLSFWVKISDDDLGSHGFLFSTGANSSNKVQINIESSNRLTFEAKSGGSTQAYIRPSNNLRDISAWYHFVIRVDTTDSTSTNRIKIYINGTQQTDLALSTFPSQHTEFEWNKAQEHNIGKRTYSSNYFNGYFTEINFIDGQAYDPSYFGETDAVTGQWNPKKYVGSYGTNGFYLNFSDNSGTTATTLGKDSSGNGNNFTPNNLSVYDSMPDTPTNNFAVMNPLTNYSGLTQGNLRFNNYNDSAGNRSTQATIALPKSGKWYWEARYSESTGQISTKYFGVSQIQMNTGYITAPYVYYDGGNGVLRNGNSSDNVNGKQVWYNGTGVPAVLAIAVDVDNNSVEYFHNGSSQGTIPLPTLTSSQEYFFTWANTSGGSSSNLNDTFNFGADSTFQGQETSGGNTDANGIGDFKYAPPSGHLALCSANLPDPTIKLPNKHFGTLTYSGNGGTQSITGLDFAPDWVWSKRRSASSSHYLSDTIRGVHKILFSELTGAEYDGTSNNDGVDSFDSNGFTFNNGTYVADYNASGSTYVGWNWNAGDTDGKTYTVKVVSDGGNKYRFDNFGTSAVTLDLAEGGTYIFNMDDASNATHPFSIGTAANGTVYTSGITYFLDGVSKTYSEYTSGFAAATTRRLHITVPASAPVLYYWCSVHSGMGGQINTNSSLGSSNFDGTLQSTVKVNATAGFSIVTYTRNGSSITVGHGLGVAPKIYLRKRRDSTDNWIAYNTILDGSMDYLVLNSTDTKQDSSLTVPTSTKFYDDGSGNMVVYAFSEVEGYSKFGSYTPNQNDDGPFVFTGFRPRWILLKSVGNIYGGGSPFSGNWYILDTARSSFNVAASTLATASSNAEDNAWGSDGIMDILSNGFKIRTDSLGINATLSGSFIYLAFAESPFKNARAR